MFKKPIEVDLNAKDITVTHRVYLSERTLNLISQKTAEIGITVAVTSVAILGAKAITDVLTHIAKTKIK